VQDGLIAVQTELGTDPAGAVATVAARFTADESDISNNASDIAALQAADAAFVRYAVMEIVAPGNDCATDDAKYIHIPAELDGWLLVEAHGYTPTAGSTGTMSIDVYNLTDTVSMMSDQITIDDGENGSDTAATPPDIDEDHDDVAENDIIKIVITAIHTTAAQGCVVTLGLQVP